MFPLVEEQSWIQARFGPCSISCASSQIPGKKFTQRAGTVRAPGVMKCPGTDWCSHCHWALSHSRPPLNTSYWLWEEGLHEEASQTQPTDFCQELTSAYIWGLFQSFPWGASMVTLRTSTLCLSIATSCLLSKTTVRFQGKFSTGLNRKEQFCLLNLQNLWEGEGN